MRRRTELIFHVVREKRMRTGYYHGSRRCLSLSTGKTAGKNNVEAARLSWPA
jgi:hypothetical protein